MSKRPWMPLYVGDYLADTRRLSTLQHGIYLLLIMEYWAVGSLPDDDNMLAQIACLTRKQWDNNRIAIASLFQAGWKHKRIEAELEKAADVSVKRQANANKRWSNSNANASANADASDMHRAPVSHSHSHSQSSSLRSNEPRTQSAAVKIRNKLEAVLSPEVAIGVIEHRRKKRSPLTELAADGLAKAFAATGHPDDAARMMIERGWQGFKIEWWENDRAAAPNARGSPARETMGSVMMDILGAANGQRENELFDDTPGAGIPARISG